MKHVPKSVVYVGIGCVSAFIIIASFWYKNQELVTKTAEGLVTVTYLTKGEHIKEATSTYSLEVTPPFVQETLPGGKETNKMLSALYHKYILDFKNEVIESTKDIPKELLAEGVSSYYISSFTEEANTSSYISLLSLGEKYFAGAAHPSHSVDTFIFDKKLKRLVAPSELFDTKSQYLEVLSRLSKEEFKKRNETQGEDGVVIDVSNNNDGLVATTSNFSYLLPSREGLVVYFPEYQVASYAAGPQKIVIPYSKLTSVLSKDGALKEYSK